MILGLQSTGGTHRNRQQFAPAAQSYNPVARVAFHQTQSDFCTISGNGQNSHRLRIAENASEGHINAADNSIVDQSFAFEHIVVTSLFVVLYCHICSYCFPPSCYCSEPSNPMVRGRSNHPPWPFSTISITLMANSSIEMILPKLFTQVLTFPLTR